MPTPLTTRDLYPLHQHESYAEVHTQAECDTLLSEASTSGHPLSRIAFHDVTLPKEALSLEFRGCVFIGCRLPHGLKARLRDSLVFPSMGELFRFKSSLYTAHTLYEGYSPGHPETLPTCFDGRVYARYIETGKRATDVKETLARTLHDHSISSALHELLAPVPETDIVGIMGGHDISRRDEQYAQVALLGKRLTERGKLMISGGGPGAMEATHLGAWMAGRTEGEMEEALSILRQAPDYTEASPWLDAAFRVMQRFPQEGGYRSVGIPTWLYGHEPATPLATHIAKYFDNSIREDGILTLARGGVIYTPGSAGTLQEVFQDAVQNHYLSFGYASPMVFYSSQYWRRDVPVYPLIEELVANGRYRNLILSLRDRVDDIVSDILSFSPSLG